MAQAFHLFSTFSLHVATAMLLAFAWAGVVRHTGHCKPWQRQTLLGLIFGVGAALGVAASLYAELQADLRGILILLAALFGGVIPGGLTALAATLTQIAVQPSNAPVAASFALAALLTGLLAHHHVIPQRSVTWQVFAGLGALLAVEMAALMGLLMPLEPRSPAVLPVLLSALVIYPATMTLIGLLMARELRRLFSDDLLVRQRDLLRTALDSLPIPISITRYQDSTFLYANPAMAEFLGVAPGNLGAYPAMNFYRNPAVRDDIIAQMRQQQSLRNYELPLQRADGTPVDTLLSMQPITYDGEAALVSGLIDITQRKQAEQAAIEVAVEREWMRSMAGFIHHMSHDIKTPISTINTSLYLLSRATDPERRADHAATIADQVARISHILDQLFEIARLDSADDAHDYQPLLLDSLLSTVAGNVRPEAERKGLRLETGFGCKDAAILGDSRHIVQAFTHLLRNAVYYTPEGGSIGLSSRLSADRASLVVEVHDTGQGIAPEHLPHIFERFYRADDARQIDTGGAGLGLAIVKKIVATHQGNISVRSTPGAGSTFTVHLPISEPQSLSTEPPGERPYVLHLMG